MLESKYRFARNAISEFMLRLNKATNDGKLAWQANEEDSDGVMLEMHGVTLVLWHDGSFSVEKDDSDAFVCDGVAEGEYLFDTVCSLLDRHEVDALERVINTLLPDE